MTSNKLLTIPLVLILLFGGILIAILTLLPFSTTISLIREGGLIEDLSAAGYIIVAFYALFIWLKTGNKRSLWAACFILLLGLRELDFHDRFTTMGIFKTKFYLSPNVPLMEKAIVTMVVMALIIVFLLYLKEVAPSFIYNLRQRTRFAVTTATGLLCIFVSKGLDSFSDPLKKIVQFVYYDPDFLMHITEESIELLIPLLFFLALFQYRLSISNGNDG